LGARPNGHTATPPRRPTNSRRFIRCPRRPKGHRRPDRARSDKIARKRSMRGIEAPSQCPSLHFPCRFGSYPTSAKAAAMSATGQGCVTTRGRAIAIEQVNRSRPFRGTASRARSISKSNLRISFSSRFRILSFHTGSVKRRRDWVASKPGHVRYAPIAIKLRSAAK
jgi:hypothetical protein